MIQGVEESTKTQTDAVQDLEKTPVSGSVEMVRLPWAGFMYNHLPSAH